MSANVMTRFAPSGLVATALEPGYWECLVETDGVPTLALKFTTATTGSSGSSGSSGSWTPYQWPTSSILEQAYCQGWPKVEFIERGHRYQVNFSPAGTFQVNISTGKQRTIRRWRSSAEKAEHLRHTADLQKHCHQNWAKASHAWILWDADEESAAKTSALPAAPVPYTLGKISFDEEWWPPVVRSWPSTGLQQVCHPTGKGCHFSATRLPLPTSEKLAGREWETIASRWQSIPKVQMVGALRIQSRPLLHAFAATREAMLARLDSEDGSLGSKRLQVQLLWHGTKSVGQLIDICNEGFDRARAATCAFGKGCYFAKDASYSLKYACPIKLPGESRPLRAIILAAVLVGDCTQGHGSMYPPPHKPCSKTGDRFENAVDNEHNPSIFVTFKDHQAVPLYVVICDG